MSDFTRTIVGDITKPYRENRAPQKTAAEMESLLNEVFASGVKAIGWTQYTPYFNDGEPCIFRVSAGEWMYYIGDEEVSVSDFYQYEEEDNGWKSAYSDPTKVWDNAQRKYVPSGQIATIDFYTARRFFSELDSGAFEEVCLNNFGDHAKVLALPNKFLVEYYEHD
jgi:hypothetical protein